VKQKRRHAFHGAQRGYSLAEMLVVIAIIGILSLISVPAFLNYQRSNQLKGSMRNFAADMRNCRQYAITQGRRCKIEFVAGAATDQSYDLLESSDAGVTWTALRLNGISSRSMDRTYFAGTTFVDTNSPTNAKPDIVFESNGTVLTTATNPNVHLQATTKVGYKFIIIVKPSGHVQATRTTGATY
jgi:prepilin-type N-terminal cleavage/methylation domain-containing protein